MTNPAPGPLLASGRAADVFDIGDGRVLRRYRPEHREHVDAMSEARLLSHVARHGYPVPEVFDATETDLVMEHLSGPTMLADLASHPWRMGRAAAALASLHEQLHSVPSLPDLPTAFGGGTSIIHLDLHPDNVLMTRRGPVVIDWQNAAQGPPAADLAKTWLILATAEVSGNRARRVVSAAGRRLFVRSFLRRVDATSAAKHLPAVAGAWASNPRTSETERQLAVRLAAKAQ